MVLENVRSVRYVAPDLYIDNKLVYTAKDDDESTELEDADIFVGPDWVHGAGRLSMVIRLCDESIEGCVVYKATNNTDPVQYPYYTYEFPGDIEKYLPGGVYSPAYGGKYPVQFVIGKLERLKELTSVLSENHGSIVLLPGTPAVFFLDEGDNVETVVLQECKAKVLTMEQFNALAEIE